MKSLITIIFLILLATILNAKDNYLIITTQEYSESEALSRFIEYRNQDFNIFLKVNSEIGVLPIDYANFITEFNPDYVLLIGNYTDFPSKTIPYSKPVESYNYWVAGQIDSLYQIKIPLGLFFVENEAELENIVSKTITFEQNLDEMPNKLYTHSGSIEALPPWPVEFNDEILSEMYNSFFKKNGYLHRHESSLDDTPNDALSDVQAINNSVKYILYHGHGNIQKWIFGMGVPGIEYLQNEKYYPIIFSASCLTGTFTGKIDTIEAPCFAVNMLSSENGAAAFIGAFNVSSRGQNPLLYGFSKAVNNSNYLRLGDAMLYAYNSIEMPETVKKYYPHVMAFEYNRARFQFHLFGDPALKINSTGTSIKSTESFQDISISPNPASDYIEINLDRWSPPSRWTPSSIRIYNSFGECIMSVVGAIHELPLQRIDISHLPAGMYFIKFGNYTEKFVVVR